MNSLANKFIGRQTRACKPGGILPGKRKVTGGMQGVKKAADVALIKRGVDPQAFHRWNESLRKTRV